jgi:hypothetical protein
LKARTAGGCNIHTENTLISYASGRICFCDKGEPTLQKKGLKINRVWLARFGIITADRGMAQMSKGENEPWLRVGS